jgi:hypothetical protein
MAGKSKNGENRELSPELVAMRAAWGDVREVIPEMVAVLERQGWVCCDQEELNAEEI